MARPVLMQWDNRGMTALINSSTMSALVMAAANAGKAHAVAISPHSDKKHKHYAESFVVRKVKLNDPRGGTRAGAVLTNTAAHAGAVEWGLKDRRSSNMPHHVLARTVSFIEGA